MRRPGYYWVRVRNDRPWIVGRYIPDESERHSVPWTIIASDDVFFGSEFAEIGPFICPLTPPGGGEVAIPTNSPDGSIFDGICGILTILAVIASIASIALALVGKGC